MKRIFTAQLILFVLYVCVYASIDYYCFNQNIQWNVNLILAFIFSTLVSLLFIYKK